MFSRPVFWMTTALLVSIALPAGAQLPPDAMLDVAEEHTTTRLEPDNPHRVWIVDPVFPHLIAAKAYIVEANEGTVSGMVNAGYVPNFVFPHDKDRFYVTETYWSRGSRGDRIDVVTAYDKHTLDPQGEVTLENGRFLVVTKKFDAGVTSDGRYLLSYNMAPATTVSVVDAENMRYIGEIETPGCALVFPHGPNRFSMLCADGAMLTASFDEQAEAQIDRSEPFFNAEEDPVFEHPAYARTLNKAWFVSYDGVVHPVDFGGDQPSFEETWSLVTDQDRQENWRPGGWQPFAVHPGLNRLYVLMHQGPRWTHKQAGEEVWVFDLETRERVERVRLEEHAPSVAVSLDDAPLLYTLTEAATLDVWDARSLEHRRTVDQLGDSPLILHVAGE